MSGATAEERQKLKRLRERLALVPAAPLALGFEGDRAVVTRADAGGDAETILVFADGATTEERLLVAGCVDDLRFLVGLVERAAAKIRALSPPPAEPPKAKDYAAEAAMLCARPAFQQFLTAIGADGGDTPAAGHDIAPADRAAARLRSLLGVGSRADLNRDAAALDRWRRLKRDYHAWIKGER